MRWDYPLLDINPVFPGLGDIITIIIIIIIIIINIAFKKIKNVAIISNYQYLLVTRSTTWNIKWMLIRIQVIGLNRRFSQ